MQKPAYVHRAAARRSPLRREDSTACTAERRVKMQLFVRTGVDLIVAHASVEFCGALQAIST